MTRDSLPADVMAYLADREMDEMADYLKRGRRFAALPLEELSHAWTEAFRARLKGESLESELSRDLQAEHAFRGVDLPLASLRADMETFTRNASAPTKEAEAEISARFDDFLKRRAKPSH